MTRRGFLASLLLLPAIGSAVAHLRQAVEPSEGLHRYDLLTPAKQLVPLLSPFRAEVRRG